MFKNILDIILNNILSITLWIGELLILFGSFFIFTSEINIFPWYGLLTIGALIYLIPVQLLMIFIYLIRCRELPLTDAIKILPIINGGILLITLITAVIFDWGIYTISIFMSVVEILLIISWIETLTREEERVKVIK